MSSSKIKNLIDKYRKLTQNNNNFVAEVHDIVKTNLEIWLEVAKINDLKAGRVYIGESILSFNKMARLEAEYIEVPDIGFVNVTNNKGTVVFADISKSTEFFKQKENYTGFVIFNSYISLLKTYARLSGGEFLEHTGDGSMIFYENKNIIEKYKKHESFKGKFFRQNELYMIFYLGYLLQQEAKKSKLLDFPEDEKETYSLVHIGASYGDVLDVNLGDMRKIISQTVWDAANNCKKAPRTYRKRVFDLLSIYVFDQLPIKVGE